MLLEEASGTSALTGMQKSPGGAGFSQGNAKAPSQTDGEAKSSSALTWEEENAQKARIRKLKKREEEILRRLENLAEGKKALEQEMARPEVYSDGNRVKKIIASLAEIEAETELLNEEWVETADALAAQD